MSEYQARKARMLELQREKEEDLRRELAAKAAKEKQILKEAEELRKRQEAAAKEARRVELMRANEALNKKANGGDGKKEMEYDPFAEDARPAPSAVKPNPKPPLKSTNSKAGPSHPSSSKQSVPGPSAKSTSTSSGPRNHAKTKAQSNSPPPLGRKERAAKAFAQSAKKSTNDSLFSIRSLVESREGTSPGVAIPITKSNSGGPAFLNNGGYNGYNGYKGNSSMMGGNSGISINGIGMSNGLKRDLGQQKFIHGKVPSKNTRENLKNQVKMEGLRQLCPDRATRDRRSIEEIQRDIKAAKKGLGGVGGGSGSGAANGSSSIPPLSRSRDRSPIRGKPSTSTSTIPKPSSISKPSSSIPKSSSQIASSSKLPPKPREDKKPLKRRPPSSTSNSELDSDDSETDSDDSRRPRKKPYDPYSHRHSPPVRLTEKSSHMDIRNEIQSLFRRPGAPIKNYNDYDDDSDDMEAGLSDVEEEERRTARIARREDELAEKEEREHRLAKLRKKKEMEKARGKR